MSCAAHAAAGPAYCTVRECPGVPPLKASRDSRPRGPTTGLRHNGRPCSVDPSTLIIALLALRRSTLLRLRARRPAGLSGGIMGSCPKPGCNYTSSRVNNLSRHMRTHNGASSRSCPARAALTGSLTPWRAGVKPYRCQAPGCGYASSDSGALRRHERIHTGAKPAKCDYRGCGFSCVFTRAALSQAGLNGR